MPDKQDDKYSATEADSRFKTALRGALSTPPKPRKSVTPKRPKRQRKARKRVDG